MIVDLLVPVSGMPGDEAIVESAVRLGRELGARLTVLEAVHLPVPPASPWGMSPVDVFDDLHAELRRHARERSARLGDRLAREGVAHEIRVADSYLAPGLLSARHGVYADACVVASPARAGQAAPFRREMVTSMLLQSGRPVFVLPGDRPFRVPLAKVVVAWKPGREATRALHDALPILRAAASVEVVTVTPDDAVSDEGHVPGVDIGAHLSRHSVEVQVTCLDRGAASVADVLLRHCMGRGADLLVSGGYGRPRLHEWALGGVTRALLETAEVPLFLAH